MNVARKIKSLGGVGILRPTDIPSLSEAARRVEALMLDGGWHKATEILAVAGQREGLRRLRELRPRYDVARMPNDSGGRDFLYRLGPLPSSAPTAKPGQASLFSFSDLRA